MGRAHLLEPIYSRARRAGGTAPVSKGGGCRLTLPVVKQQPHPPPSLFLPSSFLRPPPIFVLLKGGKKEEDQGLLCLVFLRFIGLETIHNAPGGA